MTRELHLLAESAASDAADERSHDRATDPARFNDMRTWVAPGMSQVPYSEGD